MCPRTSPGSPSFCVSYDSNFKLDLQTPKLFALDEAALAAESAKAGKKVIWFKIDGDHDMRTIRKILDSDRSIWRDNVVVLEKDSEPRAICSLDFGNLQALAKTSPPDCETLNISGKAIDPSSPEIQH